MSQDDIALMLAFQEGDYNAFAVLVERYQTPLVQFFYAQSFDRSLSEDCTQEVWRRMFRARSGYSPRAQFKTYLFRIARNLWIDSFRSRAKRARDVSLDGVQDGSEESSGPIVASDAPTPAVESQRGELKERIESALERLPDSQREVFVLAEIERMRYADIGEALGIPVGTVKSRMFNAVRKLRELLKSEVD